MNIGIITGASSGMGREFAAQIDSRLSKTDEIWLLARRREPLEELARTMHTKTRVIPIDLSDERELRRFREVLAIAEPKLTFLVCAAGTGYHGAFAAQAEEQVSAMLRLNVTGQTGLIRLCLPYMRKGSRIVLFSSGAAFAPQPDFAVYAASKAYAYSLGRALGSELRQKGIGVTTVCPGPVDTPFLERAYGDRAHMGRLKRLTTVSARRVVAKALADCGRHRRVSVCGLPMQMLYLATQSTQELILGFLDAGRIWQDIRRKTHT